MIKTPSHQREDVERKIEKMAGENKYMEHVLEKVREYFHLSNDTAPIDIEIFLNKLSKKK